MQAYLDYTSSRMYFLYLFINKKIKLKNVRNSHVRSGLQALFHAAKCKDMSSVNNHDSCQKYITCKNHRKCAKI